MTDYTPSPVKHSIEHMSLPPAKRRRLDPPAIPDDPFVDTAPSIMSHSFSRSWKAPSVLNREQNIRIQKFRNHHFPNTPFIPAQDELEAHLAYIRAAKEAYRARKAAAREQDEIFWHDHLLRTGRGLPLPMGGRPPIGNRSAVLAQETIFTAAVDARPAAPWPSVAEYRVDGERRMPAPWGEQNPKFAFDPPCEERGGEGPCEISYAEGVRLLGLDLMRALKFKDVY